MAYKTCVAPIEACAYELTWIAVVEEYFLGETIATLGLRDAAQRIAWAFLPIEKRLLLVGLGKKDAKGSTVPLPFRQWDLAEALGISLVQTNKTLSRLRDQKIAQWQDGQLHIVHRAALAAVALAEPDPEEKCPLL
jgi:CRP/FNR family transcriptional regulator, anaerobic regulatory protein